MIDNASTDNSRQIAVDMGVEVVDADNRHQFITGLNTAISLNQDLLFFMQNDVVLDKDCLKNMIISSPHYTSFIAQPVIYDTHGLIDNCGMDYKWPGYGERRRSFYPTHERFQPCGLVTTICFLTNNKRDYYSTSFSPAYYEDLSFYLATRKRMRHVLIPSAKVIHKGNHTFSQTMRKRQISNLCSKNRIKLIKKHYTGFDRFIRLVASNFGYFLSWSIKIIFQKSAI